MSTRAHPISLTPARGALADAYLLFLYLVLAGYALAGKGFAYIGLPPIFVGEVALLLGLLVLLTTRNWSRPFEIRTAWALFPLMIWGLLRTLPYIGEYKVDALRDAAVFGYAAFAIIVAILLTAQPARLRLLIHFYRRFYKLFLFGILISAFTYRFANAYLPTWPWADRVPVIFIKEGDVMVLLAGILAFWIVFESSIHWIYVTLFTVAAAALGVVDRAGMLAFFAVAGLCLLLRPRHHLLWKLLGFFAVAVFVLWATEARIEIPGGKGREISFRQIVINAKTLLGADSGEHGLDSNKDWRLNWWSDVFDYTFNGPYLWTGKGFGINLADDDGYQLFQDRSLRSPHSAHITFLARAGLPGLLLWAAVTILWAWAILRAYLKARRQGDEPWQAMFFFLACFGLALLINASFDVYLEGPMGGIWFWSVYGVGLGSLWIYQNHPEILNQQLDDADQATGHDSPISIRSARRRAFRRRAIMKILLVHNFYQQPGGEDVVFRTEYDLLRSRGQDVQQYTVHNDACDAMSKLDLLRSTLWNKKIAVDLATRVCREKFDVVHFHNTFPLISPASYSAARDAGAAVVKTLHNFRLLCANALLFRDGKPCEDCLGRSIPWPAVAHKCYRGSLPATAAVALNIVYQRLRGTYLNDIDTLIATTHFARDKFVANGLLSDKIIVKPNFLHPDPGVGAARGHYAVFVGRLSPEKGVRTLLSAWTQHNPPLPLRIIGDGPMSTDVQAAMQQSPQIQWLGRLPMNQVYDHIGDAAVLIFPSDCYETFGRSTIEAFARGTPVIASNHGAMADVVDHNRTGLLFNPLDPADLAAKVRELISDPDRLQRMRQTVRLEFDQHYTPDIAYDQLMTIYQRAIAARHPARRSLANTNPRPGDRPVNQAFLTTSWDDGHPHDFRVAELLSKYGLTGTFYIPRECPGTGTMSPAHVRDLASTFEIGAHTLDHVFLTDVDDNTAAAQITGSKHWIEETVGGPCPLFCPPGGKFARRHLRMIRSAGFTGFRTVEFLSLDCPRRRDDGLLELPTTLQARHHSEAAYLRNFAKRRALRNLWLYLLHAQSPLWPDKARSLLETTLRKGGVFHLWGHSWEIHQHHQWDRLEYVLRLMGEIRHQAPCLSNSEICHRSAVVTPTREVLTPGPSTAC